MARSSSPRAYLFPRSGAPGKRLNARVPAGALLHWEPGSAVVGPCCCGSLVTEEPGLAAWDGLEVCVLRGLRQGLGSGGQECIEVLQPCDLDELQVREGPHGVVRTIRRQAGAVGGLGWQVMADGLERGHRGLGNYRKNSRWWSGPALPWGQQHSL